MGARANCGQHAAHAHTAHGGQGAAAGPGRGPGDPRRGGRQQAAGRSRGGRAPRKGQGPQSNGHLHGFALVCARDGHVMCILCVLANSKKQTGSAHTKRTQLRHPPARGIETFSWPHSRALPRRGRPSRLLRSGTVGWAPRAPPQCPGRRASLLLRLRACCPHYHHSHRARAHVRCLAHAPTRAPCACAHACTQLHVPPTRAPTCAVLADRRTSLRNTRRCLPGPRTRVRGAPWRSPLLSKQVYSGYTGDSLPVSAIDRRQVAPRLLSRHSHCASSRFCHRSPHAVGPAAAAACV